jgi:hypothetical protein
MDVRLDESGKEEAARRVDDRAVDVRGLVADGVNLAVTHDHRARHHVHPIVHRQDRGVADDYFFSAPSTSC